MGEEREEKRREDRKEKKVKEPKVKLVINEEYVKEKAKR